jgi:2-polyprenyl-3-methyl-5-hydroxy-6-metoxy-1,4-benzoquinol methylase
MKEIINKTMDRSDLLTDEAKPTTQAINNLIKTLYSRNLYMTSWYGTLPKKTKIKFNINGIKTLIETITRKEENKKEIGMNNRGINYEPLPNSTDDGRIPWYLYWEIFWVLHNGPKIQKNMRVLDAGGTSSLFTCFLASLGVEVHSIDINKTLVSNGNKIAGKMGWSMFSYEMNMRKLDFEDESFDHAYSICVFEHLTHEIKKSALSEIARILKPKGVLSVTFDYRNPAPSIAGFGPDTSRKNRLSTKEDVKRNFLRNENFKLLGNQDFYDNGKSYLVHPQFNNAPYTFGAIFLKKEIS